ncbi:cingulin 1, putative [Babesia ovata]|uniref:Cingulin 1, putative n=1 Tax=Babesia ovata TaxID=189622 RepID=A0A2H6K6P0_9APIC|nr:cingulin 1, putative [Babesia ovata]GBE58656.1 cingulin 1, putative [Babesia ovata]
MEMLEHLFEEFERCFDEIDSSKQLLSTVCSVMPKQCAVSTPWVAAWRHQVPAVCCVVTKTKDRFYSKDVVDQLLIFNEIKEQAEDLWNDVETLKIQNEALERAVAEKSEVLQTKTQCLLRLPPCLKHNVALKATREKYDNTVGALRDAQRRCNMKLLTLQEAEEAASNAHATLSTMLHTLCNFKELRRSEISATLHLVEGVNSELSVTLEELRSVEHEKHELERLIAAQKCDLSAQCAGFEKLRCTESLYRSELSELSHQLMEIHDCIKQHSTTLSELEREESRLLALRGTLMSEAADLQRVLQTTSDHLSELENHLLATNEESSHVSTCINDSSKLRSNWEREVTTVREQATQCTNLLGNIASTAEEIDELQRKISALENENTGLLDEMSTWSTKNGTLEQEISRVQCALRSLEESKSSLKESLESETKRSSQLCDEVDELNKGITQSRILLGELNKKYSSEQQERNARLSELKQRHLDEYKEKQSVKICDLKSALKSERASVIQSKKDNIAKALEERAAQLRNKLLHQQEHRRQYNARSSSRVPPRAAKGPRQAVGPLHSQERQDFSYKRDPPEVNEEYSVNDPAPITSDQSLSDTNVAFLYDGFLKIMAVFPHDEEEFD